VAGLTRYYFIPKEVWGLCICTAIESAKQVEQHSELDSLHRLFSTLHVKDPFSTAVQCALLQCPVPQTLFCPDPKPSLHFAL
jgi:hypothetical protein